MRPFGLLFGLLSFFVRCASVLLPKSLYNVRLAKGFMCPLQAGYPELCKMRDALTLREREVFAELLAATGGSADALEAPYGWQHKLMGLEQREREIVEQLEACGVHVASA